VPADQRDSIGLYSGIPFFAVSKLTVIFLGTDLPITSTYPWHSLGGLRGLVIAKGSNFLNHIQPKYICDALLVLWYRNPKPEGFSFELNASENILNPTPLVLSEGVKFCLARRFFVTQQGLTGCETVEDTRGFEFLSFLPADLSILHTQ
jgi:hypothetical protein